MRRALGRSGWQLNRAGHFDSVVVPVGDGALITGIACWLNAHAPETRIVGLCSSGAPAMAMSFRAGKPVSTEHSNTIAEGIELVDDVVLADDSDLLDAMRLSIETLGILLEASAAAGLPAIRVHDLPEDGLATVPIGGNLRPEHLCALTR